MNDINFSIDLEELAQKLCWENNTDDLVSLVKALEKQIKEMDFTEPLYQYFREVMEKEDPTTIEKEKENE